MFLERILISPGIVGRKVKGTGEKDEVTMECWSCKGKRTQGGEMIYIYQNAQ